MAMNNIEITVETTKKSSAPRNDYTSGAWDCWNSIREYFAMSMDERNDLFGSYLMSEVIKKLTPTYFIEKMNWYTSERNTIHIGDEVEHIGLQYGEEKYIVIRDLPDSLYEAIGKYGTLKFGKTSLANGSVAKTGKHYDSLPFDYLKSDGNSIKKEQSDAK